MTKRSDLVSEICSEIMDTEDLQDVDWQAVTIVYDVGEGVVENSGFAYLDEEIVPFSVPSVTASDYVEVLQEEIKLPDKGPFIQMLIQIRRADGKIRAEFEYEDRSRWRIGPSNYIEMREALRPNFEGE